MIFALSSLWISSDQSIDSLWIRALYTALHQIIMWPHLLVEILHYPKCISRQVPILSTYSTGDCISMTIVLRFKGLFHPKYYFCQNSFSFKGPPIHAHIERCQSGWGVWGLLSAQEVNWHVSPATSPGTWTCSPPRAYLFIYFTQILLFFQVLIVLKFFFFFFLKLGSYKCGPRIALLKVQPPILQLYATLKYP